MSLLASKYLRRTFCLSRSTPIVRNFTVSGSTKDIIRNLYIRELKSYKPTQAVTASEVGQVKELSLPATPELPKIDEDISSELAAYEVEDLPLPEKILETESLEKRLFAEEEAVHAH